MPEETPEYMRIVQSVLESFPQPVTARGPDSYMVLTFMRALDQVSKLKQETSPDSPVLGRREPLNYAEARQRRVPDAPAELENVVAELVGYLRGMSIWGHPRTQENVIPPPTIASLVAILLSGLYNPILAWDEYSHRVALAEVEVVAMMADLIGYDPDAASGLFTFGGTGTVLYGMKVGLEKALAGAGPHGDGAKAGAPAGGGRAMENGVGDGAVLLASDRAHYCAATAAGWLGLGTGGVIKIATDAKHEMDLKDLDAKLRQALRDGRRVAGIICTMGTTDHFGIDDIEEVVRIRDAAVAEEQPGYTPHVHADAVIGWVWSVFNNYAGANEDQDPLGFKSRNDTAFKDVVVASRKFRNLHLADSVGVDFHKTGFTPSVSSLVLFKNRKSDDGRVENDLRLLRRDRKDMPYLYQFGEYHPGEYSLETTRSGTGVLAALANLKLFGKRGLQAVMGHLIKMRRALCQSLTVDPHISVMNEDNLGTVTLFRVYPDGVWTPVHERELQDPAYAGNLLYHNAYNICVERHVHKQAEQGKAVMISRTDEYAVTTYVDGAAKRRWPLVALKSYIVSPFVDMASVSLIVSEVQNARRSVRPEDVEAVLQEFGWSEVARNRKPPPAAVPAPKVEH